MKSVYILAAVASLAYGHGDENPNVPNTPNPEDCICDFSDPCYLHVKHLANSVEFCASIELPECDLSPVEEFCGNRQNALNACDCIPQETSSSTTVSETASSTVSVSQSTSETASASTTETASGSASTTETASTTGSVTGSASTTETAPTSTATEDCDCDYSDKCVIAVVGLGESAVEFCASLEQPDADLSILNGACDNQVDAVYACDCRSSQTSTAPTQSATTSATASVSESVSTTETGSASVPTGTETATEPTGTETA
ncbi:hypothetical protein CEP54_014934 [Fusarium duplospermum]|uniref:Extracellular membrane protein CFEM domain-containing protein n=1 Tax=Fusarium duplospermum TaxID=1325734 RepID=A0A428NSP9_9HYPO|nr:hypothetical protein CEP54_014934 [Fusarium duplospermum]